MNWKDEIIKKGVQKTFPSTRPKDISFYDMMGFGKWLLQIDKFSNVTRYIYIESKNDFIDDHCNRYTWEDLHKIYKKQKTK